MSLINDYTYQAMTDQRQRDLSRLAEQNWQIRQALNGRVSWWRRGMSRRDARAGGTGRGGTSRHGSISGCVGDVAESTGYHPLGWLPRPSSSRRISSRCDSSPVAHPSPTRHAACDRC